MSSRDQRKSDDDMGPLLFGVLIGGLIGAIAALWYAPKSGDDMRHDLEERGTALRQEIVGESVEEAMQEGRAAARQFSQRRP